MDNQPWLLALLVDTEKAKRDSVVAIAWKNKENGCRVSREIKQSVKSQKARLRRIIKSSKKEGRKRGARSTLKKEGG